VEYPGFSRGWVIDMLCGYDVVNVHWSSFQLSLAELDAVSRAGKPMFFMLHDFHYITGGCHYPATCTGFRSGCHACPQVDRNRASPALIARNRAIKRDIFARENVHLMAPSAFLRDAAVQSGIVPRRRAHVLRNPYVPLQGPLLTRRRDPLRILLIADSLNEGRKQMPLALESLGHLMAQRKAAGLEAPVQVDLVGQSTPALETCLRDAGVPYRLHGRITDHARLTEIFARIDIVLTCSNEDNWPNVLVEACSYGCVPVVGPGHGCEEFVRRYGFGQIAPEYTPTAFAAALSAALAGWSAADCGSAAQAVRADHRPEQAAAAFCGLIDAARHHLTSAPVPSLRELA
jgi:glycosyltransferase involved in cell wall biosynthesis